MTENNTFTGFEYKKITADIEKLSFLLDGYESFGWIRDENFTERSKQENGEKRTILLKRDRKIINKVELTRLQRHFEACVEEIAALEKAKTSRATVVALCIAMVGTAFMALATFAVTGAVPNYILCTVLAIPGFIGWVLPYFVYRRVVREQTAKLTPLIDAKYDEIVEICDKGRKLKL